MTNLLRAQHPKLTESKFWELWKENNLGSQFDPSGTLLRTDDYIHCPLTLAGSLIDPSITSVINWDRVATNSAAKWVTSIRMAADGSVSEESIRMRAKLLRSHAR